MHIPELYEFKEGKQKHYECARKVLEKEGTTGSVDLTGSAEAQGSTKSLIILGPDQIQADYLSRTSAYLNKLIESVYVQGAKLINDFTATQALVSPIKYARGDLSLSEVAVFLERFRPGPYTLSVHLETPAKTIEGLISFQAELEDLERNPEAFFLDREI